MDSNIKLSNVIGAPFSDYVLKQIYTRAYNGSTLNRTPEQVLYLANKVAWARLVSSVNISNDVLGLVRKNLQVDFRAPEDLAKNWILEAGTSIQTGTGIKLRQGIGTDGAYGLGGTQELGYRPMPGLTSLVIETTGRLGSLRQATVNFKVWNMDQLSVIEALYFRLGYSMLIEWGHTQYFRNDGIFEKNATYGIEDPFRKELSKENVIQTISKKTRETEGNYGGMLGIVSNFNWVFNQDGGYDCTVRIVGQGAILNSVRTNQSYTLPAGTLQEYKKNKSAIEQEIADLRRELEKKIEDAKKAKTAPPEINDPVPTNLKELQALTAKYDSTSGIEPFYKASAYSFTLDQTSQIAPDYYYVPAGKTNDTAEYKQKLKAKYEGIYRVAIQGQNFAFFIPYNAQSVSINTDALTEAAKSDLTQRLKTPLLKDYKNPNNYGTIQQLLDVSSGVQNPQNGSTLVVNYYDSTGNQALKTPFAEGGGKAYYFRLRYDLVSGDTQQYYPTKSQVIEALRAWETVSSPGYKADTQRTINNIKISTRTVNGSPEVIVSGKFAITINKVAFDQLNLLAGSSNQKGVTKDIRIEFTFETNDTGLLLAATPAPQTEIVEPQVIKASNTGDTNGTVNQANTPQQDSPDGYTSALQAMLVVLQTKSQANAIHLEGVVALDVLPETFKFYSEGILQGVFDVEGKRAVPSPDANKTFDLLSYAIKGFNSDLMANNLLYDSVPSVDFKKLCKTYTIKYKQGGIDGVAASVQSPVYITLGYLLAFLNNMCLIYESKEASTPEAPTSGTQKKPYIYIDFNPDTNLCLTSPQQFSIDPTVCMIPMNADISQYKEVFPSKEIADNLLPSAFDPEKNNGVSQALNQAGLEFKQIGGNAYQGKLMNVLLNTQYLLDLAKQFAGSDADHAVNLQPLLEKILVDINKCTGNMNVFRVSYRDDSLTVQLVDDQWVPTYKGPLKSQTSILSVVDFSEKLSKDPQTSGLLPLFTAPTAAAPGQVPVVGVQSITRQFQLKTVMSTQLASMVAISAQADTLAVNSKDHSSLSWLNKNFQDRYVPYKQDPSKTGQGTNKDTKTPDGRSNDQKAADLFNLHVETIYSNLNLNIDNIESARNYYIERMSKIKSVNPITSGANTIPVELEMTIDGIGGIIMGNAFTIPNDRLPLSLRGDAQGLTKVAFIVTGLTHTVQNNEWLTRIKGQMIKLRDQVRITAPIVTTIQGTQQAVGGGGIGASSFVGLTGNAIDDAIAFIKTQEGLASTTSGATKYISNPTADTVVYAYKVGKDIPTIGWGTTVYKTGTKQGQKVTLKDTITVTAAEAELRAEIATIVSYINKNLKPATPLTNGQSVALISLGYNTGVYGVKESKIWKGLESGVDPKSIAQEILSYKATVKGERNQGLVNRRERESQLFLS